MRRPAIGRPRRAVVVLGAVLLLAGAVAAVVLARQAPASIRTEVALVPGAAGPLDTTLYLPAAASSRQPAPAVVVSPGFGQDKTAVEGDARALAERGYVVLAWSLRGFGRSAGPISLLAPDAEIADLRLLLDRLAARDDVARDGPGDPRVALVGASYGGAVSLLGAAADQRVDAIVPVITWNSLTSAFLPDAAGGAGVFKAQYAALFFAGGGPVCVRFAPDVCQAYQRLAQSGQASQADRELLARSSPSAVLDRIRAPTLLVQGKDDTLFPLSESLASAKALQRQGTPTALAWLDGGHDRPFDTAQTQRIRDLTASWLDRYLRGNRAASVAPSFSWDRSSGGQGRADVLPPEPAPTLQRLAGPASQPVINPPGGRPAAVTSVPGLGPLTTALGGLGGALSVPGQAASWRTAPVPQATELVGAGDLTVRVRSSTGSAVLYAAVLDVAPDGGTTRPGGAVAPLRLTGLPADGQSVTVQLPTLAYVVPAGHRLEVQLASTDLGYAGPGEPAQYDVQIDLATALRLPLTAVPSAGGYRSVGVVAAGIALAALVFAVGGWLRRRLRSRPVDLGDDDAPPVEIRGLAKTYADGLRAVDGVDLVVGAGQVLGLLGPNGAGKTTTLRMLAGLITPTAGEVRLFGRRVTPGAAVLSRVGLFIEGPGLLPHLSGLDNLRLYWTSTTGSMEGSYLEEALELAGLGDAVHRPVRTFSHGMRQRLAIAQAMLGQPDLLVLDEPTNGLDPPQIREIREVLQRVAGTGRTVLVSSHLLAEVEQTCTHVVVMSRGRVVASGPVAELLGGDNAVRVDVAALDRDRALRLAAGLPGVSALRSSDGGLLVDLDGTTRSDLVRSLVGAGIGVEGVATRRRLEDVFLELLGQDGAP